MCHQNLNDFQWNKWTNGETSVTCREKVKLSVGWPFEGLHTINSDEKQDASTSELIRRSLRHLPSHTCVELVFWFEVITSIQFIFLYHRKHGRIMKVYIQRRLPTLILNPGFLNASAVPWLVMVGLLSPLGNQRPLIPLHESNHPTEYDPHPLYSRCSSYLEQNCLYNIQYNVL